MKAATPYFNIPRYPCLRVKVAGHSVGGLRNYQLPRKNYQLPRLPGFVGLLIHKFDAGQNNWIEISSVSMKEEAVMKGAIKVKKQRMVVRSTGKE